MQIKRWTGPPVETHTYLIWHESSGEAWVADAPLDTYRLVDQWVRSRKLRLTRALLTHGHFDHMLDAGHYQEAGIPIAAHPLEAALMAMPQTTLYGLPYPMPDVRIDQPLHDGDRLTLGEDVWDVWHVPGHSPGHILLHSAAQQIILGGDLLFHQGYGRVDLPGSDPAAMGRSLARLLTLPGTTRVYPGHGPDTTIAAEADWLADIIGCLK